MPKTQQELQQAMNARRSRTNYARFARVTPAATTTHPGSLSMTHSEISNTDLIHMAHVAQALRALSECLSAHLLLAVVGEVVVHLGEDSACN